MFRLFQRIMTTRGTRNGLRLSVEQLEARLTLSLMMGEVAGGDARSPSTPPPIRLDLVALHELGHALGLEHDNTNAVSIMDPYYNSNYDINSFGSDPAVAKLLAIYANVNTSGWSDVPDADGGVADGDVDLTYSFMAGGLRMDGGKPVYSTAIPSDWQSIIIEQMGRWAAASAGKLTFTQVSDSPFAFNANGSPQNDSRFGDIRIAAHYFDGPSKVLAHTYYPPPNGSTAAGDAHFDNSENWVSSTLAPLTPSIFSSGTTSSSSKNELRGAEVAYLETDFGLQQAWLASMNDSWLASDPPVSSELDRTANSESLSERTSAFAIPPSSASAGPAIAVVGMPAKRITAKEAGAATEATESDADVRLARLHDFYFEHYTR